MLALTCYGVFMNSLNFKISFWMTYCIYSRSEYNENSGFLDSAPLFMWNSILMNICQSVRKRMVHLWYNAFHSIQMKAVRHVRLSTLFLPSDISGIHLQDWLSSRNLVRSWEKEVLLVLKAKRKGSYLWCYWYGIWFFSWF